MNQLGCSRKQALALFDTCEMRIIPRVAGARCPLGSGRGTAPPMARSDGVRGRRHPGRHPGSAGRRRARDRRGHRHLWPRGTQVLPAGFVRLLLYRADGIESVKGHLTKRLRITSG